MRDPKRIKRILKKIEILWSKYPDMRLGQLIGNYHPDLDMYYLEDSHLEVNLDSELKRLK